MKKLVIKEAETIRQKVYNHVRAHIVSGQIAPHERLIETQIAQEIGTSRTPVREALHSLEREGLIESLPRIGYVVKLISDQEVAEICAIRSLIEGLAACWAMEKDHQRLLKELKSNILAAEELIARGEIGGFVELDAQFHEIIARLSGSKRLLELAQTLRHHMLRYRRQSIYLQGTVLRAIAGHKGILKAIEKGDPADVSQTIRRHLEQSKKDTLRYAFKNNHEKGDC